MLLHRKLKKTVLATVLVATVALAQTPYDEGQKALRQQQWLEAAEHFEQAFESEQGDAAMYWRAHALYKAARTGQAARQVSDLEREYPDSPWVKEAQTLQIEHQGSTRQKGVDDELRLFALHQLMERDPERALPLVMDIMRETDSPRVRRDALFVLGMSESPEALAVIGEVARDSNDPRFQAEAINILGVAGSDAALDSLGELYSASADRQIRQAVIHAHIVGEKPDPLIEFLDVETDPRLQRDIIHALGVMEATTELHEIYPTLTGKESRIAAIEAFSIAGDSAQLRQVLATEEDPRLRRAAIEGIAISDDEGAAQYLNEVYDDTSDKKEKAMVLEALFIMGSGEEVALRILQNESDPGLQRKAIEVLGVLEATEALGDMYANIDDERSRKMILEAMMIADDTDGLISILETETNPAMRAQAIEMLAVNGDQRAAEYLVRLYPEATRKERVRLIESLMILEDAPALIRLIEMEDDPQLKRQMVEMLTVMDSDEAQEYLFQMLENGG